MSDYPMFLPEEPFAAPDDPALTDEFRRLMEAERPQSEIDTQEMDVRDLDFGGSADASTLELDI